MLLSCQVLFSQCNCDLEIKEWQIYLPPIPNYTTNKVFGSFDVSFQIGDTCDIVKFIGNGISGDTYIIGNYYITDSIIGVVIEHSTDSSGVVIFDSVSRVFCKLVRHGDWQYGLKKLVIIETWEYGILTDIHVKKRKLMRKR